MKLTGYSLSVGLWARRFTYILTVKSIIYQTLRYMLPTLLQTTCMVFYLALWYNECYQHYTHLQLRKINFREISHFPKFPQQISRRFQIWTRQVRLHNICNSAEGHTGTESQERIHPHSCYLQRLYTLFSATSLRITKQW